MLLKMIHGLSVGRSGLFGLMVLAQSLLPLPWAGAEAPTTGTLRMEGLRTGSRAPFVHRITIYDADGQAVSPAAPDEAKPYSPAKTCGKCHDYAQIGRGWHFNAAEPGVDPGRPGEPWIYNDLKTGTQLPLSNRAWPGTWKPADVGLGAWDFVQTFGRHLPGGGLGEKRPEKASDPHARWQVAGNLEIDCMSCHSADSTHDRSEWTLQLEKQNYKWAHTAVIGLGSVSGEAANLPDDFDPNMPLSPDMTQAEGPKVSYESSRFNANERVLFNIVRNPSPNQCYSCHSVRGAGSQAWQHENDVHLAKGISCVDCHRNGLDHATVRGYKEKAEPAGNAFETSYSCKGCHEGAGEKGQAAASGHFGAPKPLHAGLPPLHMEKMTCTACHSGPRPSAQAQQIQTSMAHGLGLAEQDRREDLPPLIAEPVFARQADGRIAPQRAIWPAFWGNLKDGKVTPLAPAVVAKTAGPVLGASPKPVKPAEWKPLTEEQVTKTLQALTEGKKVDGTAVYIAGGQLHRLDQAGKLLAEEHEVAKPYSWALGHDVRPAAQALGAGGCTDCHSAKSNFFFSEVAAAGPAAIGKPRVLTMSSMENVSAPLQRLWSLSFTFRPAFKIAGFAASGLIAAVLILYGFKGLARLLRLVRERD